jgi:glycosyltransferase involved in cell wall biosynthesis
MVWNEIIGCQALVERLPLERFDQVYAVDGGSTDGTVEYLGSQGIPAYEQSLPGLGAATIYAFDICTTDAVVFYHPDGNMDPQDTVRFRDFFEKGIEFIVASRMIKGGRNEEDDYIVKPRKWFVLFLAAIAGLLWHREGHLVWDVVNGFRGATKRAFQKMEIQGLGCTVDYEMVIRAYKLRLARAEFPTFESPRLAGESRFKSLPTGLAELRLLWKEIWRD